MKKCSKKRIKYKNIILFLLILLTIIIFISFFIFGKKEDKLLYMIDTINMDINDVNKILDNYKLDNLFLQLFFAFI